MEDSITEQPAIEEDSITEQPAIEDDSITEQTAVEEDSITEQPAIEDDSIIEQLAIEDDSITEQTAGLTYEDGYQACCKPLVYHSGDLGTLTRCQLGRHHSQGRHVTHSSVHSIYCTQLHTVYTYCT